MNIVRDNVEFDYNGKIIPARVDTYFRNQLEKGRVLYFTYQGINVRENFNEDETNYYHLGKEVCANIDKLGTEDFKIYSKYKEEIRKIKRDWIVVDQSVFNYYMNDSVRSGTVVYYIMSIKMMDGVSIDGSAPSAFFYESDKKSKSRTLIHLQNKVKKHFQYGGVLPEEEYLNKELTEKYQEMTKWIKEKFGNE